MKAIETVYKNYRFRSRLEARWAIFFDAIGVPYEYEAQGYDLPECGKYLPDFHLYLYRTFVEVKPPVLNPHDDRLHAVKTCQELQDVTDSFVLLVTGDPVHAFEDPAHRRFFDLNSDVRITWHGDMKPRGSDEGEAIDDDRGLLSYIFHDEAAQIKARQARFEHGEQG